jgi:hypothetical protein
MWRVHAMVTVKLLASCVLSGFCAVLVVTRPQAAPTETVIATLPGTLLGALQATPYGRHVFAMRWPAGIATADSGEWELFRDGKKVGRYDGPLPRLSYFVESSKPGVAFQFSADGERYAFVGQRNGRAFVVTDGVEGLSHGRIASLVMNAAGTLVAYIAVDGDTSRLVVNGRGGRPYDRVYGVDLSRDGRHLAHVGVARAMHQLFVDGSALGSPSPYRIARFAFGTDGRHVAYGAEAGDSLHVFVDGRPRGTYPHVESFSISPNGRRFALEIGIPNSRHQRKSVVVDGVERAAPGPSGYGTTAFSWSPDSRHVAYQVTSDSLTGYPLAARDVRGQSAWPCNPACTHMVVDGVASPGYFSIVPGFPRFLTDGRLMYSALDGAGWFTLIGRQRRAGRLIGGTNDGRHVALALDSTYRRLLVDGRELAGPGSSCCFRGFSPRGRHFVFTNWPTVAGEHYQVTVDSVQYVGLGAVLFSPGDAHVAYVDGNQIVLDGRPVLSPDLTSTRFFFDSDARFHAFALRGNQLIRVDGTTGTR